MLIWQTKDKTLIFKLLQRKNKKKSANYISNQMVYITFVNQN